MAFSVPFACALLLSSAVTTDLPVLRHPQEILEACKSLANTNREFAIEGDIQTYSKHPYADFWHVSISCEGVPLYLYELDTVPKAVTPKSFHLLDPVRLRGRIYEYGGACHLGFTHAEILTNVCRKTARTITPQDMFSPKNLGRVVSLTGTVRDATRDESDANYIYLTVISSGQILHVMVKEWSAVLPDVASLVGAFVRIDGLCIDSHESVRRYCRRILHVSGLENITVIRPPDPTGDNVPDISKIGDVSPSELATKDRFRVTGTVRAFWQGTHTVVETDGGEIINLRLLRTSSLSCGTRIRAIGFPQTNQYFLQLDNATWTPADGPVRQAAPAIDVVPSDLLSTPKGEPAIHVRLHGHPVRIVGVIRHLPSPATTETRLLIESDGHLVPVDISARPEIAQTLRLGGTIAVTGTCIIDPGHDPAFFIVPRDGNDITVLANPPFWTPRILVTIIGGLFVLIIAILVRNRIRRQRDQHLAQVITALKVEERTRLAVELHDALSQTLTGVSMQIDTAAGFAQEKIPTVSRCLAIASRTIDACRMELRNTLWDLRSAALDEPSMEAAIRKTLCQNLAGVDLSVRFTVPRETFSDNTAHAILKIIRELAANALRHGKATTLKIAGAIDGDKLLFSVRDNGCGFDPDLAPGISQGHFGLQGISERLERLNGEIRIESAPGKGARVTVSLPIPRSGE